MFSKKLVKTYRHIPNTICFSTKIDKIYVLNMNKRNHQIIFYEEILEINKEKFYYLEIIKWNLDTTKKILFLNIYINVIMIKCEKIEILEEICNNVKIYSRNIMMKYFNT